MMMCGGCCTAQEFDVATGMDKAKKLTADLTHMEAEKARIGRHCEALKVHISLRRQCLMQTQTSQCLVHCDCLSQGLSTNGQPSRYETGSMREALIGAEVLKQPKLKSAVHTGYSAEKCYIGHLGKAKQSNPHLSAQGYDWT